MAPLWLIATAVGGPTGIVGEREQESEELSSSWS